MYVNFRRLQETHTFPDRSRVLAELLKVGEHDRGQITAFHENDYQRLARAALRYANDTQIS